MSGSLASRFIAFVLVLTIVGSVAAQEVAPILDCSSSQVEGEAAAATEHSTGGWVGGGFVVGVLTGPLGTGIVTGFAAVSDPAPAMIPDGLDSSCYVNGYTKKARSKNIWAAFGGGLAGTAILVSIYFAATAD